MGARPKTISSRHSTIMILARRMTAQGTDPAAVTKALMQRYMVAALAGPATQEPSPSTTTCASSGAGAEEYEAA